MSYYRLQGPGDPLSRDWRSAVQDGSGTEPGTSCCASIDALVDALARFDHPVGWVEIVEFEGALVGTGHDGEPIVSPTRELRRWEHQSWGGRADGIALADWTEIEPLAAE